MLAQHPAQKFPLLLIALLSVIVAGCGREEIRTYQAQKEQGVAEAPRSQPWTLPEGWQDVGAGRMSVASFKIAGKDGKGAEVGITPLRGLAGKEAIIVNMWRHQAGMSELTDEQAQKELKPVEIGSEQGKLFEVARPADGTNPPMSIVTAMAHQPDTSWFFKLQGDTEVVDAQKPAFVKFLKSVKISEIAGGMGSNPHPTAPPVAAQTTAPATASNWKAPADWKATTPSSSMVQASFAVPEKNGAKADVTVSIFSSDTGGALGNVNRWRGQIGLAPTTQAELDKLTAPVDDKLPGALMVDMTNAGSRLIGAIVPRDGKWYFYKIKGGEEAVAPQKEAFLAFVKAQP